MCNRVTKQKVYRLVPYWKYGESTHEMTGNIYVSHHHEFNLEAHLELKKNFENELLGIKE